MGVSITQMRNPSLDFTYLYLSWAVGCQVRPMWCMRSSFHLVLGLPLGLFCSRGVHSVVLMVYLLSCSLTTCSAHLCLDVLMAALISVTPVCWRIQVFVLLSCSLMPRMIRSVFLWVTARSSLWLDVRAHVSLPYVITGIVCTHWRLFFWLSYLLWGFSWCCSPFQKLPIPVLSFSFASGRRSPSFVTTVPR